MSGRSDPRGRRLLTSPSRRRPIQRLAPPIRFVLTADGEILFGIFPPLALRRLFDTSRRLPRRPPNGREFGGRRREGEIFSSLRCHSNPTKSLHRSQCRKPNG